MAMLFLVALVTFDGYFVFPRTRPRSLAELALVMTSRIPFILLAA
ncbi:MAG: hypothetical protein R3E96_07335 [Planctomycetota bacterium]